MATVLDKTADTAPTSDDILYAITDPTGTPADRKVQVGALTGITGAGFLNAAVSVGATSITLKGVPAWLAANAGWLLIDPFTAEAEIRKVTAVSSNTLTVSALTYAHAANDAAILLSAPIFNVKWFGAKGDDSTDDRAAIAVAYTAVIANGGGTVYLPAGTYVLARHASSGAPYGMINLVAANNIVFRGDGMGATIIKRKAATYTDDTHLVQIRSGSNITFEDLTLDGNHANCTDNDEQKHVLYISGTDGAVTNVQVNRCEIKGGRGDGIFMLGNTPGSGLTVKNVTITKCRITDHRRNGVSFQRGCQWVEIASSYFDLVQSSAGTCIDMEPTGGVAPPTDVEIHHNYFNHTNTTQCFTPAGVSSVLPAKRIKFHHNIINNGRIFCHDFADSEICHNTIIGRTDESGPVLQIDGGVWNVLVEGNHIEYNITGSAPSAVIYVLVSNARPRDVKIKNNHIEQVSGSTGTTGILLYDCHKNIEVDGNTIIGVGAANTYGVRFRALDPGIRRYNLKITGNTIKNFVSGVWVTSDNGTTDPINTCIISNNEFSDDQAVATQTTGITVGGAVANPFEEQSLTIMGNAFGRGVTTPLAFNTNNVTPICIGGVGGSSGTSRNISNWLCVGTPEGAITANIGSTAVRSDGGASTTFYVKQSGTNANGWVAK